MTFCALYYRGRRRSEDYSAMLTSRCIRSISKLSSSARLVVGENFLEKVRICTLLNRFFLLAAPCFEAAARKL